MITIESVDFPKFLLAVHEQIRTTFKSGLPLPELETLSPDAYAPFITLAAINQFASLNSQSPANPDQMILQQLKELTATPPAPNITEFSPEAANYQGNTVIYLRPKIIQPISSRQVLTPPLTSFSFINRQDEPTVAFSRLDLVNQQIIYSACSLNNNALGMIDTALNIVFNDNPKKIPFCSSLIFDESAISGRTKAAFESLNQPQ